MRKSNFYIKISGAFAVAVLLPLFFYFIVKHLSEGKLKMPRYYIVEHTDSSVENGKTKYDTIYHRIADVTLTNQLGQRVSLDSTLKGKILVIDFFFVNCPAACPKLTSNMVLLQKAFTKDPKREYSLEKMVQFISITVNPASDSVPVLRRYADHYGADHDRWWFLTGDKRSIFNFAQNELHMVSGIGDGGADDFMHTQSIVLVDTDRHIRGYYNGLDSTAVKHCADDIVLLTMEKEKKTKK